VKIPLIYVNEYKLEHVYVDAETFNNVAGKISELTYLVSKLFKARLDTEIRNEIRKHGFTQQIHIRMWIKTSLGYERLIGIAWLWEYVFVSELELPERFKVYRTVELNIFENYLHELEQYLSKKRRSPLMISRKYRERVARALELCRELLQLTKCITGRQTHYEVQVGEVEVVEESPQYLVCISDEDKTRCIPVEKGVYEKLTEKLGEPLHYKTYDIAGVNENLVYRIRPVHKLYLDYGTLLKAMLDNETVIKLDMTNKV